MTSAGLSTPAAIVIAGVCIAVGVYFGLRAQVPPAAPVVASPPTPAVPTPAVSPPPVRVDREVVARHAAEALAYQRPQLLARCYGAGERTPAEFVLNVTFDAQGQQTARGQDERPGTSTPEISRCVTEVLAPLRVPPPGAAVMVEVPLRLP